MPEPLEITHGDKLRVRATLESRKGCVHLSIHESWDQAPRSIILDAAEVAQVHAWLEEVLAPEPLPEPAPEPCMVCGGTESTDLNPNWGVRGGRIHRNCVALQGQS